MVKSSRAVTKWPVSKIIALIISTPNRFIMGPRVDNTPLVFHLSSCICFPSSDPYAWGDLFPSCHPLLEEHHSPINLDHRMTRNGSLGPLHLEGFDAVQTGHWTLRNDGHSGEYAAAPFPEHCVLLPLFCRLALVDDFVFSRAAGRQWHVSEWRRSSGRVPHHPAALPLGRPGHQWLRAHSGQTQIPNGGTVRSVDSSTLSQTECCSRPSQCP